MIQYYEPTHNAIVTAERCGFNDQELPEPPDHWSLDDFEDLMETCSESCLIQEIT